MTEMWRVLDTGLRAPAQNIALDRALLEARNADEIPGTLRFYRFTPCVLVASGQCVAHECRVDALASAGIPVQRRLSGGDAMYCGAPHLAFALYLSRRDVQTRDMQAIGRHVCNATAAALNALGADAVWRAPHDIVVAGRRLCSAGGVFEGDALLYQGVLQLECDVADLTRRLRTPVENPTERAHAAIAARITDVKTALKRVPDIAEIRDRIIAVFESEFSIEFQDAEVSLTEHTRYRQALAEIDSPLWVDLVQRPPADVMVLSAQAACGLSANVLFDRARRRIKQVWFATDAENKLPTTALALEAALNDTAVERLERNIHSVVAAGGEIGGFTGADFIGVVRRALQLPLVLASYPGEPRS